MAYFFQAVSAGEQGEEISIDAQLVPGEASELAPDASVRPGGFPCAVRPQHSRGERTAVRRGEALLMAPTPPPGCEDA
jgi:hypothetical protein